MKKKISLIHILFGIYLVLLIWIILFKLAFSFEDIRLMFGYRAVNLIPFYYDNEVSIHFREVVENLLIFIPFGLYLGMWGIKLGKSVLTGFIFSLTMEVCQYILTLGGSDITDIITNTLGTLIGATLYLILSLIFKNKAKLDKVLNILALTVTVLFVSFILFILIVSR